MEVRDFARTIVEGSSLDGKLKRAPAGLTDASPGSPIRIPRPARPARLAIEPSNEARVPALAGMLQVEQRARILHAFANHELQAAELFAWALLAFPGAPAGFRKGLLAILADEQRHCRMYCARLRDFAVEFGDYPVSGYFWNKIGSIHTPLQFICTMSLTFENANLDHTEDYALAADQAGDEKTAALIRVVQRDEIEHVRFGWTWLGRLSAPDRDPWDVYCENVAWPLRGARARGKTFHEKGRRAAGLDDAFIDALRRSREDSPVVSPPDEP